MKHTVTVFSPYSFHVGEKIHIDGGRRKGDWEVVSVTDYTVTLRCPISKREFEWQNFCYCIGKKETASWPGKS